MINGLLMHDTSSVVLYVLVAVCSVFFAFISQSCILTYERKLQYMYRKTYFGWYLISFLILSFFACATGVGKDRESYKLFFNITNFNDPYEYFEPGFNVFIGIIKLFTSNEQIFLIILAALTVGLTFKGIWDYRNEISIGWATFIYVSQYYFQGYNLMRIYFAMSILIAGAKYIKNGSFRKYTIVIFIAALVHYSVLFAVVAFILSWWLYRKGAVIFSTKYILILTFSLLFSLFAFKLLIFFIGYSDTFSSKYSMYLENIGDVNIGFKVLFNIIPFLLIIVFARYTDKKDMMLSIGGGYLVTTLVVSIMSYSVPMLGRALLCLHMPVVILLPYCIASFEKQCRISGDASVRIPIATSRIILPYYVIKIAIGIYFSFAFLLYLYGYLETDGLNNFKFFWEI